MPSETQFLPPTHPPVFFGIANINIERPEQKAADILTVLDQHRSDRQWLEFERPTIADVAVFPYAALARDGKIELEK